MHALIRVGLAALCGADSGMESVADSKPAVWGFRHSGGEVLALPECVLEGKRF